MRLMRGLADPQRRFNGKNHFLYQEQPEIAGIIEDKLRAVGYTD
jgi:hypothetical protein